MGEEEKMRGGSDGGFWPENSMLTNSWLWPEALLPHQRKKEDGVRGCRLQLEERLGCNESEPISVLSPCCVPRVRQR